MPSGLPSPPNFAASTALPQPPRTSQKVPMNSAAHFFVCMLLPVMHAHLAHRQPTPASPFTHIGKGAMAAAWVGPYTVGLKHGRLGHAGQNHVNTHDSVFLKKFSLIILFLGALTVTLILVARHLNQLLPHEVTAQAKAQTLARIAPVGSVFAGEEGVAEQVASAAAMQAAATANAAYGGTLDGKVIYDSLCTSCHTSGTGGAPKLDASGIGARVAQQGLEELITKATEGFTGTTGVMPAKGGNPAITDEQMQKTVEWMVEQSK